VGRANQRPRAAPQQSGKKSLSYPTEAITKRAEHLWEIVYHRICGIRNHYVVCGADDKDKFYRWMVLVLRDFV
jgi:hypothetical protein